VYLAKQDSKGCTAMHTSPTALRPLVEHKDTSCAFERNVCRTWW